MESKHLTEIYRKSFHISSLLIPIGYRYLLLENRKLTLLIVIPLTILSFIIDYFRLENISFKKFFYRFFGLMLRKHEIRNFTGATYLMVSVVICIAFLPPQIAFVALACLAIGDSSAAIIGMPFGKRKFKGTSKSLEGSLACFVSTYIFALFFIHPVLAFVGAISTTIAELSHIQLDDNIKIPLVAGFSMLLVNIFV